MTTATSRYFALLALTAALWGAQPLLVKITMRELNPSTMTAVRYLLLFPAGAQAGWAGMRQRGEGWPLWCVRDRARHARR